MVIKRSWMVGLAMLLMVSTGSAQDLSADEMIEGLEDFVKEKQDDTAAGTLELMVSSFPKIDEPGQKKIVKAVEKCLGKRREEGDDRLFIASLDSLAGMGPLGRKATLKSLKAKNVKGRPQVLSAAVRSLARHKDPKDQKTLVSYLVYKDAVVVAAAAESLGESYAKESEKVRKSIVQELVKNYATVYSSAIANPKEPHYRDRLNVVENSMKGSLEKLTGQSFPTAVEWQKWYNDNKKKRWDKKE